MDRKKEIKKKWKKPIIVGNLPFNLTANGNDGAVTDATFGAGS